MDGAAVAGWLHWSVAACPADSGGASGRIRWELVTGSPVLDAAGRRRSPVTMPGFHAARPPRNKGLRYPADPPTVAEIVAVLRIAGAGLHGRRLRGLVAVLWRAGLRIDEALSLHEADLDRRRGSLLVRRGSGGTVAAASRRRRKQGCAPGRPLLTDRRPGYALGARDREGSYGRTGLTCRGERTSVLTPAAPRVQSTEEPMRRGRAPLPGLLLAVADFR
jgi:integrase